MSGVLHMVSLRRQTWSAPYWYSRPLRLGQSINDTLGLRVALGLFAGVMVLGTLFSLWIPEARGKTLDVIDVGIMCGDRCEEKVASRGVMAQVVEVKAA